MARRPALHGAALYALFIYRRGPTQESTLIRLDAESGEPRWEFRVPNVVNQPVVGPDGLIYVTSFEGALYAVDPDGHQVWRSQPTDRNVGSPCFADGGQIVFAETGVGASRTYAVDRRDGRLQWQIDTGGHAFPIARSGACVVHSAVSPTNVGVNLFCIDGAEKGKPVWMLPSDEFLFKPLIGADRKIYVGARHSVRVHDFNNGELLGQFALSGDASVTADLLLDGYRLYFGDDKGVIRALNVCAADQPSLAWDFEADSEISAQPIMFDDEVFFVSRNGMLYGLNPDTGRERTRIALKSEADAGGLVASGSRLYAAHGRGVTCFDRMR
jgi:outer membrane protein assembly factor BamB